MFIGFKCPFCDGRVFGEAHPDKTVATATTEEVKAIWKRLSDKHIDEHVTEMVEVAHGAD